MYFTRFFAIALLVASPALAQGARPEALDGVDPVILLTQGKETIGKNEFKVSRGRYDYLFVTAETKAAFEKAPEKYEIQLAGLCAKMGGGPGNPADFAVVDGKIYVFGSDDCHKKFVAAPAKYLPKPAPPLSSAAADLQQGRALIDKAVASLGGAARLDAVTTLVEAVSQDLTRGEQHATIATKTMWRFPDDIRVERTTTMTDRTMTSANLLTREGAWFIGQGRVYPQAPEARPAAEQENGRRLIPLLRARRDKTFKAAALPAATIDGVHVDRVRLVNGVHDVTINLAQGTGALHSLSFTGRGPDSEIGEYTVILSDFRDVDGLRLPFAERALFNGAPDQLMTRKIDSLAVNVALDPALFAPPAGGVK